MEILSDSTFKGKVTFNKDVSISGSTFSVTPKGYLSPLIQTSTGSNDGCWFIVNGSEFVNGEIRIYDGDLTVNGGDFSVTRKGESSPSLFVGDVTINDNTSTDICGTCGTVSGVGVLVNGNFSVTKAGESNPCGANSSRVFSVSSSTGVSVGKDFYVDPIGDGAGLKIINSGKATPYAHFKGTEFVIENKLTVDGYLYVNDLIYLSDGCIGRWSDLNYFLLRTFKSPLIPANCTAFEFAGDLGVDTCLDHVVQIRNTSNGKSVIAETWITSCGMPAMSFAGCTSEIPAGTYKAVVF